MTWSKKKSNKETKVISFSKYIQEKQDKKIIDNIVKNAKRF